MKADKIKNATREELVKELNAIEEELSDRMFPVSYVRSQKLIDYRSEIQKELNMRDATLEEQQVIQENIDKISKPTGINFNDYLKQALKKDSELRDYYHVIQKNCFSCLYRHSMCPHPAIEIKCEHWKLGKCYTCKHYMDARWFENDCEAWCNGGCDKYKRSWKKTFKWYRFLREVDNDGY